MRSVLVIISFVLTSSFALAATIYVPGNYPTIQDAINGSANGDKIVVRPGTYKENIDFIGKAVTVESDMGPQVTIIDGTQSGSVVTFQNQEDEKSVLDGFQVRNGSGTYSSAWGLYCGGGIYCSYSSPTIRNSTVTMNNAGTAGAHGFAGPGGGIFCDITDTRILSCRVEHNDALAGGGICCSGNFRESPVISGCVISDNSSYSRGGGIHFFYCSPTITDNSIERNETGERGGGIFSYDATGTIGNNVISDNHAGYSIYYSGYGGGIYCEGTRSPEISGNVISDNHAPYGSGGGICCDSGSAAISNNLILGNQTDQGGGICCAQSPSIKISSNTLVGNLAVIEGGGLCGGGSASVVNSIFWKNSAATGPQISRSFNVSFCDVDGGYSGTGNIDADPVFVNTSKRDYHLTWLSPCRDAGDNSAVIELHDFEGDPRSALGTVDMGADEYYVHLYSMDKVAPGAPMEITIVGIPGHLAYCALGTGIQDPPRATPYGDLWLTFPLAGAWRLGLIMPDGITTHTGTVPTGWPSGSRHHIQALIGRAAGGATRLTNLLTLTVE